MSHHRPFSPRPRRDALDRLLDTAVTPRAPADLAARIARDVPRLAQVTPLAADPASTTRHPAQPATHLKRRAARGWILAAGMGALAAGTASIIVGTPASVPPQGLPQAVPVAAHGLAAPAGSLLSASAVIRRADAPAMAPAITPAARLARAPVHAGRQSPLPLDKPLTPETAAPEALAAMAPPAPAGSTDAAGVPAPLPRGTMGPVLPQAFGYSGGGGGGAIPSGAPVQMSGGPSGN